MADATPSRPGLVNLGSGAADELFLKTYAGEVLTSFQEANTTIDKHMVRTIEFGKSAAFPVVGRKSAKYHTPGEEIPGESYSHNERVITIDELLVASSFIANIDEAMAHYDVRQIYSMEDGRAIAAQLDKHVLQVGVKAARASKIIDGGFDGKQITETTANAFEDPNTLAAALFEAAQALDEKDIPEDDRYAFVPPKYYYTLVQSEKAINRDFGGEGAYSDGTIFRVAGLHVVKTNHLPSTNITSGVDAGGTNANYAGDFTNTAALVMHKSAVGTVKLMDLSSEADYDIRRQGTLMVSKYAVGHGVLRPESAVELVKFSS